MSKLQKMQIARKRDISADRVLSVLDVRSRNRPLTEVESVALEHAIEVVDQGAKWHLTKRDAARLGIKRDMNIYSNRKDSTWQRQRGA